MLALLSQRNFCLLWVAHTISIVGDYVFFIAITFWVYAQTGSASATGAVLITSTLPALCFAPLVGVVVDRWSRRGIMLAAESARAGLFLALLGAVLLQPEMIWPVYVVGFVQSALAAFFWPARSALLPQLIKPSALLASNALYMLSDSGVRILAPSLSTFILLRSGPQGVIVLDIITFLISAGSICLLVLPQPQPRKTFPASKQPFFYRWRRELFRQKTGLTRSPGNDLAWTGALFLPAAIIAWTTGTLNIIFPVLVHTVFATDPVAYGWLLTAQAFGEGVICLTPGLLRRDQGRFSGILPVSGCLAGGGLVLMLMAWSHVLVLYLALNLIFGAATAATTMQLSTILQERVPNHVLGKVLATCTALQTLAQIAGMGGASLVLLPAGIPWLLMLNGALYLLGGLAWLLSRGAK